MATGANGYKAASAMLSDHRNLNPTAGGIDNE
jgi:hypothetical protein